MQVVYTGYTPLHASCNNLEVHEDKFLASDGPRGNITITSVYIRYLWPIAWADEVATRALNVIMPSCQGILLEPVTIA